MHGSRTPLINPFLVKAAQSGIRQGLIDEVLGNEKIAVVPAGAMDAPPGGGDPAAAGGAPPGGDPSMGGGAPPADPSMGGGAPPMDPSMGGGGAPPAMPPGGMDPAMIQQIAAAVAQINGGAAGGGAPGAGGKGAGTRKVDPAIIDVKLWQILKLIVNIHQHQGIPLPQDIPLGPPPDPAMMAEANTDQTSALSGGAPPPGMPPAAPPPDAGGGQKAASDDESESFRIGTVATPSETNNGNVTPTLMDLAALSRSLRSGAA